MAELIDSKATKEILGLFSDLVAPVRVVFFTQKHPCPACREQRQLLEELTGLSDKLTMETHDMAEDVKPAQQYAVDKVPATAIVGEKDYGIRFYGLTSGYEFGSLIGAIVMVSRGKSGLSTELEKMIGLIDVPVHIEVMVTLSCPYCPPMVHLAHQMAIANDHIRGDMVDASEFPHLVQKYDVSGTPKTVINESASFEGALSAKDAIMEVIKAVKPKEYDRIEAAMREQSDERLAHQPDPDHTYDAIIVGAGPAGMSAAIYATRKGLDVALLGEHVGGQITNTASIENWLGIPKVSGQELAVLFKNHMERYAVAVQYGVNVKGIEQDDAGFRLTTDTDAVFRCRCVIYCAGKEYRRLGVPGEDRFIGQGIAFCATCDAPLFLNKRVAVIGGGNSAFSAARDLLPYAREIHIINILEDFQADAVLIDEVTGASHVVLHPATQVKKFLGKERLVGVRIESADGGKAQDLAVEGAFLEIGLAPNTTPVKDLIGLNNQNEIPVQRDQSTEVPGFFAAGDVTDEREKQIAIAAGAGTRAALAAYQYILDRNRLAAKTP
ncbi:MAG: protein disulfide oxidoreductase [bacterium]